jgi:hypothetical protein
MKLSVKSGFALKYEGDAGTTRSFLKMPSSDCDGSSSKLIGGAAIEAPEGWLTSSERLVEVVEKEVDAMG